MENLVYYLALFILVFVVRFFKLKKEFKKNFVDNRSKLLHVSLDLIYTASGVVIALLLNLDGKWVGAVFIIYTIFVIFSAQLEMSNDDEFSESSKTLSHGIIIIVVIVFAIFSYLYIIPSVDINGNPVKTEIKSNFTILIPYSDPSLEKHVGKNELKESRFFYSENAKGNNLDSLRTNAVKNLRSKYKPLFKEYNLDLNIYQEDIKIFKDE